MYICICTSKLICISLFMCIKRESSTRADYVSAPCAHRPPLLLIE